MALNGDHDSHNWRRKKVNCLYCEVSAEDFNWLKCHLAGIGRTVPPCPKVPSGVKTMYRNELLSQMEGDNVENNSDENARASNLPLKRNFSTDSARPSGSGRGKLVKAEKSENSGVESASGTNIFSPNTSSSCIIDDSSSKEAKKRIGRFLFENAIDFSAVKSPSFRQMIGCGIVKDQIPTCQELRGWIFKDAMEEIHEYVRDMKNSWVEDGCSILLDGWTDENGRSLINIFVECAKGATYLRSSDISDFVGNIGDMQLFVEEILREVGMENVVQIITYSTEPFMKNLGKEIIKKHRSVFWTVCTSCCIELMLDKLGQMDLIKETLGKAKIITRFIHSRPDYLKLLRDLTDGQDLVRPCKIRSILPFLILENIDLEKENLRSMFLSYDSKYSNLTSTKAGKRVAELVGDGMFWSGVKTVLKATIPLVRVMELVYEYDKAQVGIIYETVDQIKETIKEEFRNKKSQYEHFWKVIDSVWDDHLHSPLHSAGYFLNPNMFYSEDVHIDPEVCVGLLCCMVRATSDSYVQDLMTIQLEHYRKCKGAFAVGCKVRERSSLSPAQWWSKYGGECPELQRLAVRILSQTCEGASKFQLNKSLVESFLTKGRNLTERNISSDAVFLSYNLQLQNFAQGKNDCVKPDDIDLMNDWIVDKSLR